MRIQVLGGDQVADTQARQQRLGHGTGVDPTGLLEAADDGRGLAFIEHQLAVGLVFDQGHAELVEQGRHGFTLGFAVTGAGRILESRDQVGESRLVILQTLTQSRQLGAVGLLRYADAVGAEQLKGLQGSQVSRRFEQHLGARIDEQLGRQVQGLLRAADDQHLAGIAGHAQGACFGSDGLTQGRLAFAHAVLTHARRHLGPVHLRQHRLGRQATGKGHHFRTLRRGKNFTDQGAFQAGDAFGEGHGMSWGAKVVGIKSNCLTETTPPTRDTSI